MNMQHDTNANEPTPAEKFDKALTEILSVSKEEIIRREAEAKRRRALRRATKGN